MRTFAFMSNQIDNLEVSVVMCVYNAYPHVKEAVESTLASEEINFELVIVNDGSSDESKAYLDSLRDSRVRVIHQENAGVAAAANVGVEYANADIIARFDSDDIMHPSRLKLQLDFLRDNPNVDVVASQTELLPANFDQTGLKSYVSWTNQLMTHDQMRANRFRDAPLINPTAMFRKSILLKYGGYQIDVPEDYEFWMRMFEAEVQFGKIDQTTIQWRDLSTRLTRSHDDYSEHAFREVKLKYFALEWSRREERPIYIWGKNRQAAQWVKGLNESDIAVSRFVDFNAGSWKNLEVIDIPTALSHSEAFFIITVRDWQGVELITQALQDSGRTLSKDFYFV